MEYKELEVLKKQFDLLDIKFRFEKSGKNIIFNILQKERNFIISLQGIFWKSDNWLNYEIIKVEREISSNKIRNIKVIKRLLLCEILDCAIKKFF